MSLTIHRRALLGLAASTALLVACEQAQSAEQFDTPPPGFTSAKVSVNGQCEGCTFCWLAGGSE